MQPSICARPGAKGFVDINAFNSSNDFTRLKDAIIISTLQRKELKPKLLKQLTNLS